MVYRVSVNSGNPETWEPFAQSIATTIDPLRVHSMTSIRKEEKFEQASLSTYHFCVQVSETQSGLGIITLALVVPSDFLGLRIVRD